MLTAELLAVALVLTAADGCHAGRPFIRVSVEWQSRSVPAAFADVARDELVTIWRRLGVAVHWTDRHAAGWSAPAVRVVVTDDVDSSHGTSTARLGWIQFWGDHPGNVLSVSAAAALVVAKGALTTGRLSSGSPLAALRFTAARMVGRAIAHEAGHYLLRSRKHTASGLMRAAFPAHEGTVPLLDRYRLDRESLSLLRARHVTHGTARCGDSTINRGRAHP